MHILGQIFLWINLLGAAGACLLTAKLYDVRNSYLEQVEKLETDVAKQREILPQRKKEHQLAMDEYAQTIYGWGQTYPLVSVDPNRFGNGQMAVTNLGIGAYPDLPDPTLPADPSKMVVYAFAPIGQGQSRYLGEFTPSDANGNFVASAEPRPSDFANLQQITGPQWRLRTQVPDTYRTTFFDLRNELVLKGRQLKDDQRFAAEYTTQQQAAGVIRDRRLLELNGDATLTGLVSKLATVEDARNAELVTLDGLRRQIKRTTDRIDALVEENRELAKKLDAETTPVSLKTPSAIR